MVAPLLAPLLATLASNGLGLIADAVKAKGKDVVEKTLGVKLEDSVKSEAGLIELQKLQVLKEKQLQDFTIAQGEQELRGEQIAQAAVTDRWKVDMASDSWLSKNIRPLCLVFLLGMVTFMAFLNGSTPFKPDDMYIELLGELLKLAFGAYFVGRTVEKGLSMWQGRRKQ